MSDQDERAAAAARRVALAHEIKNLVGSIKLNTVNLQDRTDGTAEPIMRDIATACDRVVLLTQEFLDAEKGRVARVTVELSTVVWDSVAELEPALSRRIEFSLSLCDDSEMEGHPSDLRRLVTNLALNASQSGARTLSFTTERTADGMLLTVTDDGRGIPKRLIERVTEAGYTSKHGGSGLGLALVASVVARHDGVLQIDSEEGRGTTVAVTFP